MKFCKIILTLGALSYFFSCSGVADLKNQIFPNEKTSYPSSSALIIYVATNGNDLNNGTNANAPLLNIQTAIDRTSVSGTMIRIGAGTYTPGAGLNFLSNGISINGKHNLTLSGGYNPDFTANTGLAILDGSSTLYHVVNAKYLANLTIEGMIIQGGNASVNDGENSFGAGIYLKGVSNSIFSNCVINNNVATNNGIGGGLYAEDSSYNTFSLTISNNFALISGNAGGLYITNGNSNSILGRISENKIQSGLATGCFIQGNSNYINTVISNNISIVSAAGNGIYLSGDYNLLMGYIQNAAMGSQGAFIIGSRNSFSGLIANSGGTRGLSLQGDSNIISGNISNCSFSITPQEVKGAGISAIGNYNTITANVMDCNINNNGNPPKGIGLFISGNNNIVSNNRITRNNISTGGAFHTNSYGGGIYLSGTNNYINSIITGNDSKGYYTNDTLSYMGFGGGIYLDSLCLNNVIAGIISNNTASGFGGGQGGGIYNAGGAVTITALVTNNFPDNIKP